MAKAKLTMNFTNGGLGVTPTSSKGILALVGMSCAGAENTAIPLSSPGEVLAALVGGPLCESAYQHVATTGKPVIAVPCAQVSAGSITATFTQTGTGAGVVSATVGPHLSVIAKCTTGGALGTAKFAFSVNGGAFGSPVLSEVTSWVYRVPGTFCTMTFGAASYVSGNTYTVATNGTLTLGGSAGATVTVANSPLDAYQVLVTIAVAGTLGTAQFTYSLDNGKVTSAQIVTAATYVIPGTGIVLAFTSAAYVVGDTYAGTAVPPAFNSTSAQAGVVAALASPNLWEGVHIIGTPATAALAVTLATMLDGQMQGAQTNLNRYVFGVSECPNTEADATITAAFFSLQSNTGRVQVCIGNDSMVSQLTSLTLPRNKAWDYCQRLASSMYSDHPGAVEAGARPNITAIDKSQAGIATADAFDSSRFVTSCTYIGISGYFITCGNTMDSPTSDYAEVQFVRVIDAAATIAQSEFFKKLNGKWRIDPKTGHIDQGDAAKVEGDVETELESQLTGANGTSTNECSAIKGVVLDPTNNLLSSKILNASVQIVPFGYSEAINVNIGFTNPLLS